MIMANSNQHNSGESRVSPGWEFSLGTQGSIVINDPNWLKK